MIPAPKSIIDTSNNASHMQRTPSATQRESIGHSTRLHQTPQIPSTTSTRSRPTSHTSTRPLTRYSQVIGAVSRPSAGLSYPKGAFLGTPPSTSSEIVDEIRCMKVGIETEFHLCELEGKQDGDLQHFAMAVAKLYNGRKTLQYPRMRETLRAELYTGPYTEWCLVRESSLESSCSPWGLEMVSPIYRAFSGSVWRKDVDQMWDFIKTNYRVIGNYRCSTHIHIGRDPGYELRDIKRIAQAVIHFEPAFEALVPAERRECVYAKSNWLDAPSLARANLSRADSIAVIDAIANDDDPHRLLRLLHPLEPAERYNYNDRKFYAWNFLPWLEKGSVEFRKPPASVSSTEALSWAELAMSFIQASTNAAGNKFLEALQQIPPTVGGLRWFLRQFGNEPGMNQPGRLERLFRGKKPDAHVEPKPIVLECLITPEQDFVGSETVPVLMKRLNGMVMEDRKRIVKLAREGPGRYWDEGAK